jgi:hypothetical protein
MRVVRGIVSALVFTFVAVSLVKQESEESQDKDKVGDVPEGSLRGSRTTWYIK